MPRTFYLIDGHAQIFRAYYAPFRELSSPTGEPTRAIHVFCQMILNLLRDKKPDYLAVALDVSDETVFRRDLYPDYKAHRDPAPEDLPQQAERIMQILRAAEVPMLHVNRFEADDVMATLARRLAGDDLHVYFVSKDKDLEQLLSPHVSMYDVGKDTVISADNLPSIKGWRPDQAIEAQILIGDSVDNVPGVPGIGPKTAAKLLEKYGSARGVVEHAAELTPKQRENVLAFADQIELVRQLVTLRTDVPIEFELASAEPARFNWSAVKPIFGELGIRRLADQLPAGRAPSDPSRDRQGAVREPATPDPAPRSARDSAPANEPPPDDADIEFPPADVAPARRPGAILPAPADLRSPDGGDYQLINTSDAFDAFVAELARQPEFAVDTETTGVNPVDADLVGMSFAWRAGHGCYLAIQSVLDQALALDAVRAKLGPILADPARRKIGHNLKYDLIVLRNAGLPVAGPIFDTMIAAFVLEPTRGSYAMDALVPALLGHTMIPISDLIGKGRDQLRMDQVPLDRIAEYAAEDADYTWRMKALFEPQLAPAGVERLFLDVEMPLVSVLTDMEFNGVRIDVDYLAQMSRRMAARVGEIVDAVHGLVGEKFNLDSTRQLAAVLFDKLKFRVVRTTKTARSTDADTLETLAAETNHPVLGLLLEYREIQKLRGTYVDALPAARSRRTGRIHTSYHQTGAITGRLSSSEPNLQNIPVRSELGREIRRAFVPRSADERLIVADYSQIELRVLAHFCGDEQLIRAFVDDRDIHAFVASQINNVPLDAVTKDMRARAKAVNFGIIYGQTAFGLAQGTGLSRTEAQEFIDAYFRRYPRINDFIQQCIRDAKRDGGVRTILGRRRPIENIDSRNRSIRTQAERWAVNTVIQGSAADLIKLAMNRLHARIAAEQRPLRMLLQVHDELVCESPAAAAEDSARVIVEVMSGAMELKAPLKVDAAIAQNWLEAK